MTGTALSLQPTGIPVRPLSFTAITNILIIGREAAAGVTGASGATEVAGKGSEAIVVIGAIVKVGTGISEGLAALPRSVPYQPRMCSCRLW